MELIYLTILSALSIVLIFFAFIVGLHYGSKTKKEEVISIPNPVKVVKESINSVKEQKQISLEQQIEDINLANIDTYDGTDIGQKEFPE